MLVFYNTLTRKKEPFVPITPNFVRMYVCGPTVYDFAHLGNARPVVVFDVLYRLLKHIYPHVEYVRNITDIDDKIMKRAAERGQDIKSLTLEMIDVFHADMDALGALRPDHEPKATDFIQGMICMIEGLIEKGFAYEAEGHALFKTDAFEHYGALSRLDPESLETGLRVEVAPFKRSPHDFVLWKPSDPAQPGWDSPWGRGRPGWHIECSAMSAAYLGKTFDIHGGGIDLIFPHHENEIAQSCAFHGTTKLANYWLHNGHLTIDNEKMAKSLGNFVTVHDLLQKYSGEVLRYAFLSTHYRQPLNFSEQALDLARNNLNKLYTALRPFESLEESTMDADFLAALKDDLNTPLALSTLHDMAGELNKTQSVELATRLKAAGMLLGLLDDKNWFSRTNMDEAAILDYIQKRKEARDKKDFQEADRIRGFLESQGILLEDTATGTLWRTM